MTLLRVVKCSFGTLCVHFPLVCSEIVLIEVNGVSVMVLYTCNPSTKEAKAGG